jgi:hypothetical protein
MKLEIELTKAKVLLGAVLAVAKQNCFGLLAEAKREGGLHWWDDCVWHEVAE